jgi:primary-amine oxidase
VFPSTRHDAPEAHPLDPLSAIEITEAVHAVATDRDAPLWIVSVSLSEPDKRVAASPSHRLAAIVARDPEKRETYEYVVDLRKSRVRSSVVVADGQPMLVEQEFVLVEKAVKADTRWQKAMARRGVTDFDLTTIDAWGITRAALSEPLPEGARWVHAITYAKADREDNQYAHPVQDLLVTVDIDTEAVVRVDDHGQSPIPKLNGNYRSDRIADPANVPSFPAGLRTDLKPLEVEQRDGVSFVIQGHLVRWQKWEFRVGWSPREGLVLHDLSYDDRGESRSILSRVSVSEMVVPYGDPAPVHRTKNAFDVGECGLGFTANSLELGCDCPGGTQYLDAVVNDMAGEPVVIKNAICIHEEDAGLLWKHTNMRSGGYAESRRSRKLVVSSISTIGNYDYGFYYHLGQDGSFEFEAKLTGIISTGAHQENESSPYGTTVAPGLYGPNHQHFFCVRLDPAVDGRANSVIECDSRAVPVGPDNPVGNAWTLEEQFIESESEGARDLSAGQHRFWRIANEQKLSPLGAAVSYALVPGETATPLFAEGAPTRQRAQFINHNLWVTAYDPGQLFAAGDYPHLSGPAEGLPAFAAADRPLRGSDLVVWYVFGVHHVVRPEDWPVMPVHSAGFTLKPFGFFDGNPGLDVPESASKVPECHR